MKKTEPNDQVLQDRLVAALEHRITNPRGNRIKRFARLQREYLAANPGKTSHDYHGLPTTEPYVEDRQTLRGRYALYWNNRLLPVGKLIWRSKGAASAAFTQYVRRLLFIFESEAHGEWALPPEILEVVKTYRGNRTKEISKIFQRMGLLDIRLLDIGPEPPEEE